MSLLEFRGVDFHDGQHAALKGIDVSVGAGERLFVFGRSGSGKGTFLRLAAGILEPQAGSVTISAGGPVPLGWVPKEGGLISNLSLLDNAVLPLVYHRLLEPAAARLRAQALFEELGIARKDRRRPADVGVSARRLALLARALLPEPELLVVEDPLAEVDAETARTVKRVLERAAKEGRAVVLGAGALGPFLGWEGRFMLLRGGRSVLFENSQAVRDCADPETRAALE